MVQLLGVSLVEEKALLSEPRLEAGVPPSIPTGFASVGDPLAIKTFSL